MTHLPVSTQTFNPMTTIKSIKNLTHTPFTTDLSDYFDWLSINYGITKATNSYQSITKGSISHKNSKHYININSLFLNLCFL
jgi:hypothetical protein